MSLLYPKKRDDEKDPPSPEEMFVQQTGQKVTGFWEALRQTGSRMRTFKTPKALQQIGHDIWYGNMGKRPNRQTSKALSAYKWLWDVGKHDHRTFAKPYTWGWALYPRKKRKR